MVIDIMYSICYIIYAHVCAISWPLKIVFSLTAISALVFVLEMNEISKSFFKVKVLESVTLKVKPGEVHALVGENGAGKSTLMKILMGIYERDSGEIVLDQQKVVFQNPREAINRGISMIHQEFNSVLDLDVAENIFLGREQCILMLAG